MTTPFEQEYFDTLRAIEERISQEYAADPELLDYQIEKVLNALIRHYTALSRGKEAPALKMAATEGNLFLALRMICELHRGQDPQIKPDVVRSTDELILCLKRIQRSVRLMAKRGRRAYLDFIQNFFEGS